MSFLATLSQRMIIFFPPSAGASVSDISMIWSNVVSRDDFEIIFTWSSFLARASKIGFDKTGGRGNECLRFGKSRKTLQKNRYKCKKNRRNDIVWHSLYLETKSYCAQVNSRRSVGVIKTLTKRIHSDLLPLPQSLSNLSPCHALDPKVLELNSQILTRYMRHPLDTNAIFATTVSWRRSDSWADQVVRMHPWLLPLVGNTWDNHPGRTFVSFNLDLWVGFHLWGGVLTLERGH